MKTFFYGSAYFTTIDRSEMNDFRVTRRYKTVRMQSLKIRLTK